MSTVQPRRRRNGKPIDLVDPALYLNRELSLLAFNQRVLAQAMDESLPLLERLRFLCISCTNLDEFFEIRVAAVRHQLEFGGSLGPDELPPSTALKRIHAQASALVDEQYRYWNEVLRPQLDQAGIRFLPRQQWTPKQAEWLRRHFKDAILPVLSPLGLDPAHPFPRILNKSLNIVVVLQGKDAFGRPANMAVVRAPRSLSRVIHLPPEVSGGEHDFVLLSAVLSAFVDELFPGMKVKAAYQFRVTRNSELLVDEDEVDNLASALKGELAGRGFARAMRLEIAENCPPAIVKALLHNFELPEHALYRINGPVNLNRVSSVIALIDRPELKFAPFQPRIPRAFVNAETPFDAIRRADILLHHPFDAFKPVIDLVDYAARDPDVLAIKQTLYRTADDSELVNRLIEAARNGKDVTVVIELRARFDEEANIRLADRLQEVGVQVVYGVVGYKTHAKMLLIVRREGEHLRRYVHLSTGNYHQGTARAYTDLAMFTADKDICHDVHSLFQQVSGLAPALRLKRLLQSPFTLHSALRQKIEREAEHARAGRPSGIIAKLNAINEPAVIRALYRASQAGVAIDLIVRGACSLRPGVPGVSETIRVRSILGRFLEHSRVYCFCNGGEEEIFCASADWMERNLLRRIEICWPLLDAEVAARVRAETLEAYLADNRRAWLLQSDGSYLPPKPDGELPYSAQDDLLARLGGGVDA